MRLFGWVRSRNSVFGLIICLIFIGLTTAAAAEPMMTNEGASAAPATDGKPPIIQVFKAAPMVLDTPTSAAIYTFKVKNAKSVQINEAGTDIKNIDNPTLAALSGDVQGMPAAAIPTDASGKFVCTIVATNDNGSVQAELTLALAKELLPQRPPPGTTGNKTKNKSYWLAQIGWQGPLPPSILSTTNPTNPNFPKCPEGCYCLEPGNAASLGFTQKCSDQRCFYDPENQRSWYCYKPTPGWCCANEKVIQNTKVECAQLGGYWSTSQNDAVQACQPRGYCCLNGQIYGPATQSQCAQMGGSYWSTNQAQVVERCQPPCYCCLKGQVYQTTQAACLQAGGNCYASMAQAYDSCQQSTTCWCCAYGKVFQATQAQCTQSGGACYATQSQATAACRQTTPGITGLK